ncbi:MAG TPA: FmdE family protein, partial [Anaerolineales bacterium]
MRTLQSILDESAERHHHLCPRQVLGVRMGLLAGELLGLELPRFDKRLLVITETDGCSVDGIACATGCSVGRRTMRIEDYGKVAASFIDTETGAAIRLIPLMESRQTALAYAPKAHSSWEGQLLGYQRIHAEDLFQVQKIELAVPLEKIISRPGAKAICETCG